MKRYGARLRDTNDLCHIRTGYGRDALGEQCGLAFSYSQTPSWGTLFIAWAGAREIRKGLGRRYPIYAAVREGQRIGGAAQQVAPQNIEALLAEPLAAARRSEEHTYDIQSLNRISYGDLSLKHKKPQKNQH